MLIVVWTKVDKVRADKASDIVRTAVISVAAAARMRMEVVARKQLQTI